MRKILLQTTISQHPDDWTIDRFSVMTNYLAELKSPRGERLYDVVARNRENLANGDDAVLSRIDQSDFDQVWLFGVDVGNGLSENDCSAIKTFMKGGGGLLTSRDHQDLGISFCTLGGVGDAHHFHSKNPPEEDSRQPDDTETPAISWPNYHSGRNGDFQVIQSRVHPVLHDGNGGTIGSLPAHPHEGAVSVPAGSNAQVIATGRSTLSGRPFNIAVAFDPGQEHGRALADSSFHHFLDYNLDPASGCPSFVTEPAGDTLQKHPEAMHHSYAYFRNIAAWLSR